MESGAIGVRSNGLYGTGARRQSRMDGGDLLQNEEKGMAPPAVAQAVAMPANQGFATGGIQVGGVLGNLASGMH